MLNYFGAPYHPKHVLGGSRSLPPPPVAAHPRFLWLMTLRLEPKAVLCVALMGGSFGLQNKITVIFHFTLELLAR